MTDAVPTRSPNTPDHLFKLAVAINQILNGGINSVGTLTLTAGATSTAVTDARAGANSVPLLIPASATAAAAVTSVYVSARAKGSFTISHNSTADTNRTYLYALLG